MVRSDKFKTGKEQYLDREISKDDNREIIIGRLPVMVKSDLCWTKGVEKGDCDFDHGGYFLIKGAEKVSSILFTFMDEIIPFNLVSNAMKINDFGDLIVNDSRLIIAHAIYKSISGPYPVTLSNRTSRPLLFTPLIHMGIPMLWFYSGRLTIINLLLRLIK